MASNLAKFDQKHSVFSVFMAMIEKKLFGLKSYVIENRESIDIILILHFYEKSTSRLYEH